MYRIGDVVSPVIDPSRKGTVVGVATSASGVNRYRVQIDNSISTFYEEQLKLASFETQPETINNLYDLISVYYTKKLGTNTGDSFFTLNTGNIEFNPFQYRPLSKIIKSDKPRLLIADEVGVGKTIEAGLIFEEFKKRGAVESCLIICPKDLTLKWKSEMKHKFGETFEILDSDRLRYCLKEFRLEDWPIECSKCIVGLELARREEFIEEFYSLEEDIHFDMLIVDEAHHVINSNSYSHAVVEYFCNNSDIAILLSATPVQLKSTDLFSLLNLLRPDRLVDVGGFVQMAAPNVFINSAIRKTRQITDENKNPDIVHELEMAVGSNEWARRYYGNNRLMGYWIDRLKEDEELTSSELVDCVNDLESLHSFSFMINRTRRKDIKEFTQRDPETISNCYSSSEQEFYDCATSFKQMALETVYGQRTARLIMSTIERQLTSCIPAFVGILDRFISNTVLSLSEFFDDDELECDDQIDFSFFKQIAEKLRVLSKKLPEKDSKTENLLRIVENTLPETDDGKLLVFSFFKHTLSYLHNAIEENTGARVAVITGSTKIRDRESIRNRFRLPKDMPEAIDVLLCSEVGCEGLDYEFCSRLVNYDIPWNPMKLEQRIGRIDRFGQKAKKVKIFNFITDGTVEEKVFFRCYERLGIFKSTIGDLECILGEVTEKLTQAAFDTSLTKEQQDALYAQMDYIQHNTERELSAFEDKSKDLFLMDEIKKDAELKMERQGQRDMMSLFIQSFFKKVLPKAKVTMQENSLMNVLFKESDKQLLYDELYSLVRSHSVDRTNSAVRQFTKFLKGGETSILLSFDNGGSGTDIMSVDASHPLVLLAEKLLGKSLNQLCNCSLIAKSDFLPKGDYVFGCYEWKEYGHRNSISIKTIVYDRTSSRSLKLSVVDFERVLCHAQVIEDIKHNYSILEDLHYYEYKECKTRLSEINLDVVNGRIATITEYYDRMIRESERLSEESKDARMKRMYSGKASNLRRKKMEEVGILEKQKTVDIISQPFILGTLRIE